MSLVEVLFAAVIFGMALVPLVVVFSSARQTGASAGRQIEATLQTQVILEAVLHLSDTEMPPVAAGESEISGAGGSGRWEEVRAWLAQATRFPMDRKVFASKLADGAVEVRVEASWERVPNHPETRYVQSVRGLRPPPPRTAP